MGFTVENERRQFLRYRYDTEIKFGIIDISNPNLSSSPIAAASKDVSASGLLFTTKAQQLPTIGNLLVLNVDIRTATICKEIEENALIVDGKLLGRVVRVEDNGDGTFSIGVAFVRKSDQSPTIEKIAAKK